MENINVTAEVVRWKTDKKGLVPIAIRINVAGNRVATESLPLKIKPEDWDIGNRKVKATAVDHQYINQIVDTKLQRYRSWILKRQAFQLPITPDMLKQLLKGGGDKTVGQYAEAVLETKTLKDGKGYDEETKRRYRDEIKRLEQFAPGLLFSQTTAEKLNDYRTWMQLVYRKKDQTLMSKNGIWNAFKFLRMVFNEAVKDQILLPEQNPFTTFKFDGYETNLEKIKYLEKADLDRIEKTLYLSHLNPLTVSIGWRFLAMCVCGMRISDAMLLDDAFFDDAGNLRFKPYKTRRHGNQAQVPIISERQRFYLQQTLQHPLQQKNAKNFRTTFNDHLKVIAGVAGISINLTSHVGRHTMGSFLVDAGIDTRAAMAMLGIKSSEVLETYMHLKQSKLHTEALKLKGVF